VETYGTDISLEPRQTIRKAGSGAIIFGVLYQSKIIMEKSESPFNNITVLHAAFTSMIQQKIFLFVVLIEESLSECRDENQFISGKYNLWASLESI
jgi:hypothetical protein